jgi:AcrR family transcriptional regulator
VQQFVVVARKYELRRRAERQAATRRRIVEAAIELHRTKGPARTTLSDIARLAGVQRHTLYRHFPTEREIGLACSGLHFELNPPPDPEAWRATADPAERLRRGLADLYEWYERMEDMFSCVLRDAEVDPLTREMFELRGAAPMAAMRAALADAVPRARRSQAALDLALDFRGWQRLHASGLSNAEAAETMARAILCQ